MTIAVDFDGTLCENDWPMIGEAHDELILWLRRRRLMGDKLILWTCREGALLDEAVLWCLNRGLKFDAVNDNLPEEIEKYGNNCRKVNADVYLDDKNRTVIEVDRYGFTTVMLPFKAIYDEHIHGLQTRRHEYDDAGRIVRRRKRRKRKKRPWLRRVWRFLFGEG